MNPRRVTLGPRGAEPPNALKELPPKKEKTKSGKKQFKIRENYGSLFGYDRDPSEFFPNAESLTDGRKR